MNLWSRTLLPVPGRVLKPGWFSEQYKTRWNLRQEFKSCRLYPSPLALLPKQIFSPHWGLPSKGRCKLNGRSSYLEVLKAHLILDHLLTGRSHACYSGELACASA